MAENYTASPELVDALGNVAVVMGGSSAERQVSLESGEAVFQALQNAGVRAEKVDWGADTQVFLARKDIDRVFLALHGRGGEDGTIQGLFESLEMPYTGSGVMASSLAMDKLRTKYLWQGMNLPTPRFGYVEKLDAELISQLVSLVGFPLAVKPAREGSSFGVFKVGNRSELESAILAALKYDDKVLLEQWIEGPEYTVGIVNGQQLPLICVRTDHPFYDYQAKYESDTTQYLIPSGLSEDEEASASNLAERAFRALGCAGWGRVDLMRDTSGRFWLLEVNTTPGMTSHSLVPMAAKSAGLCFEELVVRILQSTLDPESAFFLEG